MPYLKSLDGLRGVAVSLVVLFHYGLFPAGWVGVQIFFVLSGYLITTILLGEKDSPPLAYLGRFYWRRSLRIFPLYFFVLALSFAAYLTIGEPKSLGSDWAFLVTYTTNFGRLRPGDIGPSFTHLWSLAVEEQFYLFWPLLVYFLPEKAFRRTVAAILVLTPALRLAFCVVFLHLGRDSAWIGKSIYCLPFAQFDAFAAGAAISLWRLNSVPHAGRWFLVALSITALCGMGCLLHDHFVYRNAFMASLGYPMYLMPDWGFVWGYSLLNLVSCLGIICATQRLNLFNWAANAAVVRLGRISYGVYVFHVHLLLIFPAPFLPPVVVFPLYVASLIGISELSFRWIETPFLALKTQFTARVAG